ncbi:hypothetical protein SDC9_12373 [bioreactor metagenome]|uniref:T9SS type A sorting domain-containing protein n=1 Tax=bioreactor metagenome TaxID=1076179 RepID=A0A644TIA8_9ZZZZ
MKRIFYFLLAMIIAIQGYSQATLNEGFEGTSFPPDDWRIETTSGGGAWESSTSIAHGGTKSAKSGYYSGGCTRWLITPKLTVTATETNFSFWIACDDWYSDGDNIDIFVSTTDNSTSSFGTTALLALTEDSITTSWAQHTVDLSTFIGQDIYVAIRVTDNFGFNTFIDDVTGPELFVPACPKPTALYASNPTTAGVDLGWTDATGSTWNIQYMLNSETDWANSTTISGVSNPYTFTTLNPSTVYKARVQTDCGTEQSEWSSILPFATACDAITVFPWTEGFESAWSVSVAPGNASAPLCWININKGSGSSNLWSRSTYNYHTGTGAAQMYTDNNSQNNDWLISPKITLTGNERLRFWAQNSNETTLELDEISIWISDGIITSIDTTNMGVYDSIQGFTQVFQTGIPTGAWQQYELNLSQYSGDRFIAFVRRNEPNNGWNLRLDDIEISELPLCNRPTNVTVSNITTTDAEISWVNGSSTDASWWIYYKQSTSTTYDSLLVSSNPYIFTNLIPSSGYDIYVVTDCSTELSEASPIVNFRTLCDEISTLPWSDNFDTYGTASGTFPPCWTRPVINNGNPQIATTNHSSPASLFFQSLTTVPTYAVTPAFTADLNTLMVSFWLKAEGIGSSQSGTITVGVMSNPNDTTTFEPVQIISPSTTSWIEYRILLSGIQLQGSGNNIAFKHNSNANNWFYWLDDVVVDEIPACPNVYGLSAEPASTTSLSVNWTDEGDEGDGYVIAYSSNLAVPFDPTTATTITVSTGTTLPYIINGFNPGDSVWVAVQRGCGGTWTNSVKVNLPTVINSLPLIANFEDSTLDAVWTITNGTQTNKWYIGVLGANDSDSTDGVDERGLYVSSDNGSTVTYDNTSSSVVFVSTLVEFDNSPSFELSFDWTNVGENNWDGINVYLLPLGQTLTPGSLPNSQYKLNPSYLTNQSSFQTYNQALGAAYSNTVKQLVFCWRNDGSGGANPPAKIDNISLAAFSCATPYDLAMDSASYNGTDVYLSWTEPQGATSWIVEYQQAGTSTWTQVVANSNPFTLTGLNNSSTYQARVRSLCSANDTSLLSLPISFNTACDLITTFPWSEGFESTNWAPAVAPGNKPAPNCWTVVDKGDSSDDYYWDHSSNGYDGDGSHSGNGHAMCYTDFGTTNHNDWLITPQIALTGGERLRFWAMRANDATDEPDEISVYISDVNAVLDTTGMGQNGNMPNFTQIFTQMLPLGSWQEYEVNLSQYSGNRYIAFVRQNTPDGYFLRLDDVLIDALPSCAKPTNVTSVSNTQNSIELSWVNGNATDASWYVYYRPSGTTDYDSVLVNSNPYILGGLTSATTYDIYVRTNCGTELSEASPVVSLATTCYAGAISVFPWTEGFENGLICWQQEYVSGTINWSNQTSYDDSISSHGGQKLAYFYYDDFTAYTTKLVSPLLDISGLATPYVSFWHLQKAWGSDQDELKVFYRASADSSWTQLVHYSSNITAWQLDSVALPSASSTYQIAFEGIQNWGYGVGLDDVTVYDPSGSACTPPTNLAVSNIHNTSATISWIPSGTESLWQVRLEATGTPVDVSSTTYTFPSTLTPATHYTYFVRANCGTNYSAWVQDTFTTTAGHQAVQVTTLAPTAITQTNATFQGTYVQGTEAVTAIGFEYKTNVETTWTDQVVTTIATPFNYSINTLIANTNYEVRAYAVTPTDSRVYGNIIQFVTPPIVEPTVITEQPNSITNTTATFRGSITQGSEEINARGFEYKLPTEDWSDATILSATGTTTISAEATNLQSFTNYIVRAYARTASDTYYGQEQNFQTLTLTSIDQQIVTVVMYPNPASQETKLVVTGLQGDVKITISDVQGRIINAINTKANNNKVEETLNVSDMAKGVYYVRLQNDQISRTQKLIVK